MSQNIRAVPGRSERQGSIWNVPGSGRASMSDSYDPGEALDRRAVEADALVEGALELGRGHGHRLQETEHVGEPEPHEADVALLEGAEHELLLLVHAGDRAAPVFPPCYRRDAYSRRHGASDPGSVVRIGTGC